jgi:hypothetical protein
MNEIYCRNCKIILSSDNDFCPKCGISQKGNEDLAAGVTQRKLSKEQVARMENEAREFQIDTSNFDSGRPLVSLAFILFILSIVVCVIAFFMPLTLDGADVINFARVNNRNIAFSISGVLFLSAIICHVSNSRKND